MNQQNMNEYAKLKREISTRLARLDDSQNPPLLAEFCPEYREVGQIPFDDLEHVCRILRAEEGARNRLGEAVYNATKTGNAKREAYQMALIEALAMLDRLYYEEDDFIPWYTFEQVHKEAMHNYLTGDLASQLELDEAVALDESEETR